MGIQVVNQPPPPEEDNGIRARDKTGCPGQGGRGSGSAGRRSAAGGVRRERQLQQQRQRERRLVRGRAEAPRRRDRGRPEPRPQGSGQEGPEHRPRVHDHRHADPDAEVDHPASELRRRAPVRPSDPAAASRRASPSRSIRARSPGGPAARRCGVRRRATHEPVGVGARLPGPEAGPRGRAGADARESSPLRAPTESATPPTGCCRWTPATRRS